MIKDEPRSTPTEEFKVFFRPLFSDTSLYFFNDSMIWTCYYGDSWGNAAYPIHKVIDFRHVDSCICHTETWQRTTSYTIFEGNSYRLLDKKRRATLAKINDKEFHYFDLNESGIETRSDTLIFEFDNLVKSDTSYIENIYTGNFDVTVSQFFRTSIKSYNK